jgi:hypothetical protein
MPSQSYIRQKCSARKCPKAELLPFENASTGHLAQHLSMKMLPNTTVKVEKLNFKKIAWHSNLHLLSSR